MTDHRIVSPAEWLAARKELLAREKHFTRLRDELSAARRALPWVRIDKAYTFETATGPRALGELFAGRHQLLVYHFMFDPTWDDGCKSCSFWADNYDGIGVHLAHRDVTMIAISRAPLATLDAFKRRMGWHFEWVSSGATDFNYDLGVSFTPEQLATGKITYNYDVKDAGGPELPGISAFYRDDDGSVFHTYSTYGRGLDMLNGAYHYLDLMPKGRDEAGLPYGMAWLRHHDRY